MAKFRGKIGMNRGPVETGPGIFTRTIEDVEVSGEMKSIGLRWPAAGMQDGIKAKHILSIIVPEKESIEFNEVVYVIWHNVKWSVVDISYERPRINLTLGGRYNG